MKRKIWISTVAGAILVLGTAANMSDNPSQSPSDDSVVINDWLIVGEPESTGFTPGDGSLTVGRRSRASGPNSTAIGSSTEASGFTSTAMGAYTRALGEYSTAMGGLTEASGRSSTAMGYLATASGYYSTAMGLWTRAYGVNTTVVGKYNESILASSNDPDFLDNADGHLFVVGNGTRNDRSNAMVVYHDGAVDVGKNDADDTVPLQVTSDGSVVLARAQGDISMGAFGSN